MVAEPSVITEASLVPPAAVIAEPAVVAAPTAAEPVAATSRLLREDTVEAIGFHRRLWATLRDLLIRPARVVRAYLAGDSRRYLPPVRVFFSLAGVYMLGLSPVQPTRFDAAGLRATGLNARQATQLSEVVRARGLTPELAGERFQSRLNTVAPLSVALALFPLLPVMRLFDRGRRWHEHLMFLLGMSNAIWLASLILLPLAALGSRPYWVATLIATYGYMALLFVAIYPRRGRLRSALRFGLFALADTVVTGLFGLLLQIAVFFSVLYW